MTRQADKEHPITSLIKSVRNLILAFAACLIAMASSYHLVQYLLTDHGPDDTPEATVIRQADELRMYSNDLLRLTAEFLRHAARETPDSSETLDTWLKDDLRPRINAVRRQMHESALQSPAFSQLLSAADRVAAMASNPGQANLRRLATSEVLDANVAVEEYIASLGVARYLTVSPGTPRFTGSP
jgi:hypothetical protein